MQAENVKIGEFTYSIGKLGTRAGVRTAALLTNTLAPVLSKLPEDGFNPVQMAAALEPLFSNPALGPTLERLCDTFAEVTVVHGQTADGAPTQQPLTRVFETHFADRYDDLMQWLWAAMRASMSSFLRPGSVLATLAAQLRAAAKSQSKSPD